MQDSPSTVQVSSTQEDRWYSPFIRTGSALLELLAHCLVVAGLLTAIRLFEMLVHWLWGPGEYLFFGKIPLKYIVDSADLAILVGFLTYGVYYVVKAYMRAP